MAVNTDAIFGKSAVIGYAKLTTANTTRSLSSTTGMQLLLTAGADGTMVTKVTFMHAADDQSSASGGCVLRLYLSDDAAGTTNECLFREIANATLTGIATAIGAKQEMEFPGGLFLPSGKYLLVTVSVTSQWFVTAEGYSYTA